MPARPPLPSIAEHLARVLALAEPRVGRGIPLNRAAGLRLAADATSTLAVPPFDNSAMDGFALHAVDLAGEGPWTFPVAGDIAAGSPAVACPPGAAVRVMTGAPVPPGPGIVVVPVEQTTTAPGPVPLPSRVTVTASDPARAHVRPAGSGLPAGSVVATAGALLDAGTLAALVSAGVEKVDVHPAPTVAVISTGDELVAWPGAPGEAQLPDSNLPMITALSSANGAGDVRPCRAGDRDADLAALLDEASATDIIVTTGGISAGAYDVVRATVGPTGRAWFGRVDQRPGGPQGAGTWNGAALLCLPGNPVAAYVSFHLYVAPLIAACAGSPDPARRARLTARPCAGFPAARGTSPQIVPVRLDLSGTVPVAHPFSASRSASSDVTALTGIDGYVVCEPGAEIHAGPLTVHLTRS